MEPSSQVLLHLSDWSLHRRTPAGEEAILQDINLELKTGQWVAVLGSNGSGKSSLLKYLASDDSPLTATRAIMFQDPDDQIIASTVERELSLGRPGLSCEPLLEEFGLDGLTGLDPRLLSAGQKQRLVMAVALVGNPEVLFCDEPTALQDDFQARWVLDRLVQWRNETAGTLVTATCDRNEVQLADQVLVLQDGRVVLQGPSQELITHPVVEELLGPAQSTPRNPRPAPAPDQANGPVLSLRGLGCRFRGPEDGFSQVDLDLGPGQRIGITGPNGCGKSTLLAVCVGARKPDQGTATLVGHPLYQGGSRDLDHGLALLAPQFPEYIFTRSTVVDELALDPALAGLEMDNLLKDLGLPVGCLGRNPHSLSSGQKRRLALGLVLFSGRPLLLLDEPTAALDWRGRRLVADLVDRVPAHTTLLVASHDRRFLNRIGCKCMEMGGKRGLTETSE